MNYTARFKEPFIVDPPLTSGILNSSKSARELSAQTILALHDLRTRRKKFRRFIISLFSQNVVKFSRWIR